MLCCASIELVKMGSEYNVMQPAGTGAQPGSNYCTRTFSAKLLHRSYSKHVNTVLTNRSRG